MAKPRRAFLCRSCGNAQSRWLGKCPDCGTWDSLEETVLDPGSKKLASANLAWAVDASNQPKEHDEQTGEAKRLNEIDIDAPTLARLPSGLHEFDRVLGAGAFGKHGLVPGSAVLVGGEPGVGKSTLLLQAAITWAHSGVRVLYVSSEESAQQVASRATRILGAGQEASAELFLLHDTNLARILEQARKTQPRVLIIDSVQMIFRGDVPASPGSVTQLRRCAADLVFLAKNAGIAVVLVGHVTKDGRLAGPRLLEHLVDTVVSFEGDRSHAHRVVRAVKNRFGTTQEIGLFAMEEAGLREVPDGGSLAGLTARTAPGTAICPILTGARCLLVEVQALTATGFLGAAKRKCSGLDANRLAMIIAVLEQHADVRLADRDVFVSSVGGLRVTEPGADLALLMAIAGAHTRRALPPGWAVIGEVGLSGEVRPVPALQQRIREAQRLGWATVLAPVARGESPEGVIAVRSINDALQHLRDVTVDTASHEPKTLARTNVVSRTRF